MTHSDNRPSMRLGTRASRLALIQTNAASAALRRADPGLAPEDAIVAVPITTTGDAVLDRPLAEIGGKGLFSKEIDAALLDGRIDAAVHSCKDLETRLPKGIVLAAVLPRADVRDALIASDGTARIADLPEGARLGTSSLRRAAQALHCRPDLRIIPLRGNVQTRLGKVADGSVCAAILALAGLNRLGIADRVSGVLNTDEMLPAAAQGAVALTCREDDTATLALLARVHDRDTGLCVNAERALLAALDGSCKTPIAGLAELSGEQMDLRGLVATADGTGLFVERGSGPAADGVALGTRLGDALRTASEERVSI